MPNSTLIGRFLGQVAVKLPSVENPHSDPPRTRRLMERLRLAGAPWAVATALGAPLSCGGDQGQPEPSPQPTATEPSLARARLLTRSEYQRTVEDLLHTSLGVTNNFPPEPVVNGFSNNAESHKINPLLLEQLRLTAQSLASEAAGRSFEALGSCPSEQTDVSCDQTRIEGFATRAFRRPVSQEELAVLLELYGKLEAELGSAQALGAVIEAILISPQFLYRVEAPADERAGERVQLGSYELASRLAYFLTGSMPDPPLFEAAQSEALLDRVELENQARRLLETARARDRVREFHTQWLSLDRLASVARDDAPADLQIAAVTPALVESLHRYLDDVFWSEGSSVETLYSAPHLFLDETLLRLYAPSTPAMSGWARLELANERAGLLTQPALLTLLAHPDQSAPVKRGVFVRDAILCQPVAAPPPTVNNTPPDPDPNMTTRERFAVHTADASCSKCHRVIDPLGFGFEAYDQWGRYRTEENGLAVDDSGSLEELIETSMNGAFDGALELGARVAESDTALDCLGQKWFTFALGRSFASGDRPSLDQAVDQSRAQGGSVRELLVALTISDAFQWRAPHDLDGGAP